MKKNIKIGLAGVVVVLAAVWLLRSGHAPHPTPVEDTFTVRAQVVAAAPYRQCIVLRGNTQAYNCAMIRARTVGTVETIAYDRGAVVPKGAVLLTLSGDDRQQQLEAALANVDKATIAYRAAEALNASSHDSRVALASRKYELEAACLQKKQAEMNLDFAKIVAPFDGVVANYTVDMGTTVAPGVEVACCLQLHPLRVVAYCTEQERTQLKPKLPASVQVAGSAYPATILSIAPMADTKTRTYRVDLCVENPSYALPEGATAEATIEVTTKQAHFLPSSAISLGEGGVVQVKLLDQDDTVSVQSVTVLSLEKDGVWVEGLPSPAKVITLGHSYVVSGQKVRAVTIP